jgi:serpin B
MTSSDSKGRADLARLVAGICIGFLISTAFAGAGERESADNSPVSEIAGECKPGSDEKASDSTSHKASEAVNRFAVDVYQELRKKNRISENLVVSPVCLEMALAMVTAGAAGQTRGEMEKTLHLDWGDQSALAQTAIGKLADELTSEKHGQILKLANRLWLKKGTEIQQEFSETIRRNYRAEIGELDFANPVYHQTINHWVETQTAGMIRDLLPESPFDRDTNLVLTTAVYFKQPWKSPFDKKRTTNRNFQRSDREGDGVNVAFMSKNMSNVNYAEFDDVELLELPYENAGSILVVLPKQIDGLAAIEEKLSMETINGWRGKLKSKSLQVVLPRFRITTSVSLAPTLIKLGIRQAFAGSADLSGISATSLKLSDVVHKSLIDVNETGTEAASATGTKVGVSAALSEFLANHPFLFVVQAPESVHNTILFIGRLTDPAKPMDADR